MATNSRTSVSLTDADTSTLTFTPLSTENYDPILLGWSNQNVQRMSILMLEIVNTLLLREALEAF